MLFAKTTLMRCMAWLAVSAPEVVVVCRWHYTNAPLSKMAGSRCLRQFYNTFLCVFVSVCIPQPPPLLPLLPYSQC